MSLQFFKPNSKGLGAALSVSFNSKGEKKGVFFEIIKQVSWDDSTKKGKFSGGQKILSKFNTTEAAQFIDCIQNSTDFEKPLYHTNGETSSQINFKRYKGKVKDSTGKWVDGDSYKGYALSISKGDVQVSLGLTFAEAKEFQLYLEFCLQHIFSGWYSDQIAAAKERAKTKETEQSKKAEPIKKVEDFVEVEEDDLPF